MLARAASAASLKRSPKPTARHYRRSLRQMWPVAPRVRPPTRPVVAAPAPNEVDRGSDQVGEVGEDLLGELVVAFEDGGGADPGVVPGAAAADDAAERVARHGDREVGFA